jgi:small subunit ribosomal protein S17
MTERTIHKTQTGVVLRRSGDKTIVVEVERLVRHPKFGKFIRRHCRYHVHDEKNQCQAGDFVKIMESRPISRTKRWTFKTLLTRNAPVVEAVA